MDHLSQVIDTLRTLADDLEAAAKGDKAAKGRVSLYYSPERGQLAISDRDHRAISDVLFDD